MTKLLVVQGIKGQEEQEVRVTMGGRGGFYQRGGGAVGGQEGGYRPRQGAPSVASLQLQKSTTVSKFLTFFQRKNTVVVEIYGQPFYTKRPTWEDIAEFVYKDLCPNDGLRKELLDVQMHPVKMLIFVKFKQQVTRDEVAIKLQGEGVYWTAYNKAVKGYSLDKEVKFIRIMGISPETAENDVKETIEDKLGEVMEIKRGLLDPRRMPGVTNGMWTVKVKILDPDKELPSYIHRQDEGEIWSLNFEGRRFVCWKCGSSSHIGDKCREPGRTFEETFPENDESESPSLTWAAVVRNKGAVSEARKELERKIAEENKQRDRVRVEAEQKRLEDERLEKERLEENMRKREEARHRAEREAKELFEKEAKDKIDRENHDEFLRTQNQLAVEKGVALPDGAQPVAQPGATGGAHLSQADSDEDLLATTLTPRSNTDCKDDSGGILDKSVQSVDQSDHNIVEDDKDGNKGKVLEVDNKEVEQVVMNSDDEVEKVEDFDGNKHCDKDDELPTDFTPTGSSSPLKVGEVLSSENKEVEVKQSDNADELQIGDNETLKVGEVLAGKDVEEEEAISFETEDGFEPFSDGPKSSDIPFMKSLFDEENLSSSRPPDKRDRDVSGSEEDDLNCKQLRLSVIGLLPGQEVPLPEQDQSGVQEPVQAEAFQHGLEGGDQASPGVDALK